MKIIKEELDNLEKVKDRKTTQGIVMKNAEQESNEAEKNFEEVAGKPEELKKKKPFLGAKKQETPKEVKTPKPQLEEALFNESTEQELRNAMHIYLEQEIGDALDNMAFKMASALGNKGIKYDPDWASEEPPIKLLIAGEDYMTAIIDTLLENKPIDEALEEGKMKNGIMLDTTGEPLTFWDKIYAELDGNLSPEDNDYKMLVELPSTKAIRYQNINTDYDGNIEVVAATEDALQHAINVANYYDLEYKTGVSNGNNAQNAFYCKIIIPQYLQDKNVTYDSRKQKYKDKKEEQ